MSALQTAMNSIVDLEQQILKLKSERTEFLEALKGVVKVADRATMEFDAARAAIAKAEGVQL